MLRASSKLLATFFLAALLAGCGPKSTPDQTSTEPVVTLDDASAKLPEAAAEVVIDETGPAGTLEPDTLGPGDGANDEAWSTELPTSSADGGLVVHEWGTFTSVQGPDGLSIGGLHHEDEALPFWVYRRNWSDPYNYFFEELPEEPLQQLETPVLYFYSDTKQSVKVDVSFPEGIVGQWFPDAASYSPAVGEIAAIASGAMTWDLTLVPGLDPATFVPVEPDEIWAPSRRVASTPVEMTGPYGTVEREQFVFYRGLGMFDPPVRVTSAAGELQITNASPDALAAVFVLRAGTDGGTVTALGPLPAEASFELPVPDADAPLATYVANARAQLAEALRDTGLTDDEAQAMVDTWTRSWFGNLGLRVLYVAPRGWADALLPMEVAPTPTEVVRTLVGRIEAILPEEDLALVEALHEGKDVSPASLGRFAEPRLRHALLQLSTPAARERCQALLDEAHATP